MDLTKCTTVSEMQSPIFSTFRIASTSDTISERLASSQHPNTTATSEGFSEGSSRPVVATTSFGGGRGLGEGHRRHRPASGPKVLYFSFQALKTSKCVLMQGGIVLVCLV